MKPFANTISKRPFVATRALLLCSILTVCIQLLFCPTTLGVQYQVLKAEDARILFPPDMTGAGHEVAALLPGVRREVEEFFQWRLGSIPTVVISKSKEDQGGSGAEGLVVGYAIPQRHLIVIFYSRTTTSPTNLRVTLKHELCHLLLHERVKDRNIPRWLDEGIAQLVSGTYGEFIGVNNPQINRLSRQAGGLISLRDLTNSFPSRPTALLLAYAQSRDFLKYITDEYGIESIHRILMAMGEGLSIDQAIRGATGLSLNALELKWRQAVQKDDTWLVRLSYYLYEILFGLGALITVYAFFRKIRTKGAYEADQMDEEL